MRVHGYVFHLMATVVMSLFFAIAPLTMWNAIVSIEEAHRLAGIPLPTWVPAAARVLVLAIIVVWISWVVFNMSPQKILPWLQARDARHAGTHEDAVRVAIWRHLDGDAARHGFLLVSWRESHLWGLPNLWKKAEWYVFLDHSLHAGITKDVFGKQNTPFTRGQVSAKVAFPALSMHQALRIAAMEHTTRTPSAQQAAH